MHPCVHGNEEHPALHILFQSDCPEEADESGGPVQKHQRGRARPGTGAHRQYRGAAGRVSEPKQRGRRVHH